MIALALLWQVAAPLTVPLTSPAEWAVLPPRPLAQRMPEAETYAAFVRAEVAAGRCPAPPRDPNGGAHLTVDMALLVDKAGTVQRIVPRAISCPTVEQYAAGVAASLSRGNLTPPVGNGWFRFTVSFAWR